MNKRWKSQLFGIAGFLVLTLSLLCFGYVGGVKSAAAEHMLAGEPNLASEPNLAGEPTAEPIPTEEPTAAPTPAPRVQISFGQSGYSIPYQWTRGVVPTVKKPAGAKVTLVYTIKDTRIATVSSTGVVKGVRLGTTMLTVGCKEYPEVSATCFIQVKKENPGWHMQGNKRYYVSKEQVRILGYRKVCGSYYYFDKTSSCAISKKWKYIKIGKNSYKLYFSEDGKRKMDVSALMPKGTRYKLVVSFNNNVVMAYAKDGNKGYTIPVRAMICSVGMPGHETITGTYRSLTKAGKWHPLRYNSNGQYATRIRGPYLFHSVTYNRLGNPFSLQAAEYKKLGRAASHGCIRMLVKDAKWIYSRSGKCIAVLKKKAGLGPFEKPVTPTIKKSSKGYYDPTDDKIKN